VKLNVITAGPSTGKKVILLHGFPESALGTWHFHIAHFAKLGYHVIAPDQRGMKPKNNLLLNVCFFQDTIRVISPLVSMPTWWMNWREISKNLQQNLLKTNTSSLAMIGEVISHQFYSSIANPRPKVLLLGGNSIFLFRGE